MRSPKPTTRGRNQRPHKFCTQFCQYYVFSGGICLRLWSMGWFLQKFTSSHKFQQSICWDYVEFLNLGTRFVLPRSECNNVLETNLLFRLESCVVAAKSRWFGAGITGFSMRFGAHLRATGSSITANCWLLICPKLAVFQSQLPWCDWSFEE